MPRFDNGVRNREPDTRIWAIFKGRYWNLAPAWGASSVMLLFLVLAQQDTWSSLIGPVIGLLLGPVFTIVSARVEYNCWNPRHWVGPGTGWEIHFGFSSEDELNAIWQWCRENCRGRWKLRVPFTFEHNHGYGYFSNKRDAVAFRLFHDPPEDR